MMSTYRPVSIGIMPPSIISLGDPANGKKCSCGYGRRRPLIRLWRNWNKLSQLQKVIVAFIGLAALLSLIVLVPELYSEYSALGRNDIGLHKPDILAGVTFISDREREEQHDITTTMMGTLKNPRRRGPPSLKWRKEKEQQQQIQPPAQNDKEIPPGDSKAHEKDDSNSVTSSLWRFSGPSNERQKAVVGAMRHAWSGYKKYAWGHDQLKPISRNSHEWFGVGLTILDSLDTLLIMNLTEEYNDARAWVALTLTFDKKKDVNLFETTIRCLGGLLSAYHLTDDKLLLEKAVDLADRLMGAFSSPSPIPFSDVNLHTGVGKSPKWGPDSSTSEVTTIQLEMTDLSRASGEPRYEEKVSRVMEHIHGLKKTDGLVPMFINPNTGDFKHGSTITMGARADSYYEYLLKHWLQTGQTNDKLKQDYMQAMEGVRQHLVAYSKPGHLLFLGELLGATSFSPKMDHLVCYLPGTLALGHYVGHMPEWHLQLATDLINTCYHMYSDMPTFLSPEIAHFNQDDDKYADIIVKPADAHNLLRPETVESLFYLYQFTGNTTYQEWGWKIFEAFEKYTKVDTGGYTSINDVKNPERVNPRNSMETFFLGETLKYFYLLFSDDVIIPLEQYVINTEAHILPMYET